MAETLALLALAAGGFLLWSNLRSREAANAAIRATCRAEGVLFLDDTVALASVRPARDGEGRLTLRWTYKFAYSDTGRNRCQGRVAVEGGEVTAVEIGLPLAPEGTTLH